MPSGGGNGEMSVIQVFVFRDAQSCPEYSDRTACPGSEVAPARAFCYCSGILFKFLPVCAKFPRESQAATLTKNEVSGDLSGKELENVSRSILFDFRARFSWPTNRPG